MYTLVKVFFILASIVTVVLIGSFFVVLFVGHDGNATFALGWLSLFAMMLWIPIAGVSVLLMSTFARAGQTKLIGKRSVAEWGILAFLLYLAAHLINSSYSSVWSGLIDGWHSSPVLATLTLCGGLTVLVSCVALLLRHKWSLQLMLPATLALFVSSNYGTLSMYNMKPFMAFLVIAGIDNFSVMIVLASYIYLRKSKKMPNPRPEVDSQVIFAAAPIELSSGEPRRLSEFR
jgi:hypothetical protein